MKGLDLYCCAGGASMGYALAGFEMTGVDAVAQKNYPFHFELGDALTYPLDGYSFVHCSPPCQAHSAMSSCRPGLADSYPQLIEPLRERLEAWGGPYVIENVPGAPLKDPIELCGFMFGLELYRHRLFESNMPLTAPPHPVHEMPASRAGHWTPGTVMSVAGHVAPIAHARQIMGIDWTTREELAEAIPPAYTAHLGAQIRQNLEVAA